LALRPRKPGYRERFLDRVEPQREEAAVTDRGDEEPRGDEYSEIGGSFGRSRFGWRARRGEAAHLVIAAAGQLRSIRAAIGRLSWRTNAGSWSVSELSDGVPLERRPRLSRQVAHTETRRRYPPGFIERRADDDVGGGSGLSRNAGSSFVDLENIRYLPACDEMMRPMARLIEGPRINGLEIAGPQRL